MRTCPVLVCKVALKIVEICGQLSERKFWKHLLCNITRNMDAAKQYAVSEAYPAWSCILQRWCLESSSPMSLLWEIQCTTWIKRHWLQDPKPGDSSHIKLQCITIILITVTVPVMLINYWSVWKAIVLTHNLPLSVCLSVWKPLLMFSYVNVFDSLITLNASG